MAYILGIDPGISGGLALIATYPRRTSELIALERMPTARVDRKLTIDANGVSALLEAWEPDVVFVERQQSMPRQGVSSTFTTGYRYGLLMGLLEGYEVHVVSAHAWTRALLSSSRAEGKERSIEYVLERYPKADLAPGRCRTPQDGLSDAICIAEYGLSLLRKGAA